MSQIKVYEAQWEKIEPSGKVIEPSALGESDKAWPEDEQGNWISRWKPELNKVVPGTESWELVEKLGSGSFGEVWRSRPPPAAHGIELPKL